MPAPVVLATEKNATKPVDKVGVLGVDRQALPEEVKADFWNVETPNEYFAQWLAFSRDQLQNSEQAK